MRALALVLALTASAAAEPRCVDRTYEDHRFVVCTIDLRKDKLRLFDLDGDGKPFGSFARLDAAHPLAWAMNAGMYDAAQKPVGLYVEAGHELHAISLKSGFGNFHLEPNGVFWVRADEAHVQETQAYVAAAPKPEWATQSGPMLVIDGAYHPQISPTGTSRKRRNGVGVSDEHHAVFVMSEEPVTFFELAHFFHDGLGCKNALFLDGTISSLFDPEHARHDAAFPLGPIVAVPR